MEYVPDFAVQAGSQEVEDNVTEDISNWWLSLGQEQQNDYLSSWDALSYGDYTRLWIYKAKCTKSFTPEYPYPGFLITIH